MCCAVLEALSSPFAVSVSGGVRSAGCAHVPAHWRREHILYEGLPWVPGSDCRDHTERHRWVTTNRQCYHMPKYNTENIFLSTFMNWSDLWRILFSFYWIRIVISFRHTRGYSHANDIAPSANSCSTLNSFSLFSDNASYTHQDIVKKVENMMQFEFKSIWLQRADRWTFFGSMFFCCTVFTTVGELTGWLELSILWWGAHRELPRSAVQALLDLIARDFTVLAVSDLPPTSSRAAVFTVHKLVDTGEHLASTETDIVLGSW